MKLIALFLFAIPAFSQTLPISVPLLDFANSVQVRPFAVVSSVGALQATGCVADSFAVVTGGGLYRNSATGTCVWTLTGANAAGAANAVQSSNGTGGLLDTGCTAVTGVETCPNGFSTSGPFQGTGPHQSLGSSPPSGSDTIYYNPTVSDHLTRRDSAGLDHDLEMVLVGAYEVGAQNASAAFVTADLTNNYFVINNGAAKTLVEASCISDSGTQAVTVKIGGTTLFSISCVASGSYSTGTTNGTTGYIIAASMGSTAVAAHTQLDLSGTANGTTKDIKLFIYGSL